VQERPAPLTTPERRPYIVIGLPEPHGDHVMKVPSLMAVSRLVKSLDKLHVAALMAMQRTLDKAQMLHLMKEAGPEMASVLGALIGMSWSHHTLALDTGQSSELIEYGGLVFEELHDEGYPFELVVMLGMTLIEAVRDQSEISAEVSSRASFFLPLLGLPTSVDSTSASPTSETPMD